MSVISSWIYFEKWFLRGGLFFVLVMSPNVVFAEKLSVQSSYSFPDSLSDASGCQRALARAKVRALEKACGTHTSGGSTRFRNEEIDSLNLFLFEMVGGSVVGADVVQRNVEVLYSGETAGAFKECRISANISVVCDQGVRDPAFAPDFSNSVHLNEMIYREGEAMTISLEPTSDMYVYIFQYLPYSTDEENVFQLFPNSIQSDNFLEKGESLTIPGESYSDIYELVVGLPPTKKVAAEEIMVISTKKKIVLPESMSVDVFHRLLSEVPLGERREAMIPYQVSARKFVDIH